MKAEIALHSIVKIPLLGVIHLPGGQRIVTGPDGSLRVWNLENGKQMGEDWTDGE